MRKLGVKLWTSDLIKNHHFFDEVVKHVREREFDYIELFVFPETYEVTAAEICQKIKGLPVIIHNSHSAYGFDTGRRECEVNNVRDVNDSKKFADMLNAEIIIVHAGCGDKPENLQETVRQFNLFNDKRIAVENLPFSCSKSGKILHGMLPEEIKIIKDNCGCKFCLDFSHATCAANHKKLPLDKVMAEFSAMSPDMFHLCDGFTDETVDKHLHYGEGNYDLKRLINDYIYDGAFVTMETGYTPPVDAGPWIEDRDCFRCLEADQGLF